ncbi:MAG TPA: ABC transporter ATP-binding protein [Gaiellaceae bacterium]|nr:ABC transporter ATP-binding protein [Gaiellaceae bacterium]
MSSDLVLEAKGIETHFLSRGEPVKAVRGVSFSLARGEKLGIVGESGSGKSALALTVLGLLDPPGKVVGGEVWLHGRRLDLADEREWSSVRGRHISLVYQDPMVALDPVKTIGWQIAEVIRRHNPAIGRAALRRRVVELLREVGVGDAERRADSYPHQYSGGMRQRVVVAMALANDPDVLIADEPTTALDVTTQAQVLDLLDRLTTDHGSAVILITHNMGVVAEFCDRVLVMYAGRIVEEASTSELFAHQAHPYTEALLSAVMRPDQLPRGPLPTIPGAPVALDALPDGCAFAPRCPVRQAKCELEPPPNVELGGLGHGKAECHFAVERTKAAPALPR